MTLFTEEPLLRAGAKGCVISEYNRGTQSSDLATTTQCLSLAHDQAFE